MQENEFCHYFVAKDLYVLSLKYEDNFVVTSKENYPSSFNTQL